MTCVDTLALARSVLLEAEGEGMEPAVPERAARTPEEKPSVP